MWWSKAPASIFMLSKWSACCLPCTYVHLHENHS
jgi:hypothetical protein